MDCLLKRRQGCKYRRRARHMGIILGTSIGTCVVSTKKNSYAPVALSTTFEYVVVFPWFSGHRQTVCPWFLRKAPWFFLATLPTNRKLLFGSWKLEVGFSQLCTRSLFCTKIHESFSQPMNKVQSNLETVDFLYSGFERTYPPLVGFSQLCSLVEKKTPGPWYDKGYWYKVG